MDPIFFESPGAFGAWLEEHHATAKEVLVGFYKKSTGRQTMSWSEAVDEALCWGWIDSAGKRIDDDRHTLRFTPRRPGSIWSKVNVAKAERLVTEGRMRPPGLAAFEARTDARTGVYSFESTAKELPPDLEERFRSHPGAWRWFVGQPPGYRRTAIHWVLSAKKAETRDRRLATLIADSEAGQRIKMLRR